MTASSTDKDIYIGVVPAAHLMAPLDESVHGGAKVVVGTIPFFGQHDWPP